MFRLIILTGMLAMSAIAASLFTGTVGEYKPSFVRSEPTPPRRVTPGNTVRRPVSTNSGSNMEPFIGSSDDGSSIRRKQPNQNSVQRPVNTNTAANLPPFIGGTDDGSSIRPAGDTATTSVTQKAPATVNRKRPRNQDIEVENDETHLVGHNRTKRGQTVRPKTIRSPRPSATRVKKSPTSQGDQPEMTRTKPRKPMVRPK